MYAVGKRIALCSVYIWLITLPHLTYYHFIIAETEGEWTADWRKEKLMGTESEKDWEKGRFAGWETVREWEGNISFSCRVSSGLAQYNQYNLCRSKMFDIVCLMSAAGPLVCYPEWGSGDQPSRWKGGDSLHGQQLWHLTLTGQAVHEWRSSHQGGWLPGKEGE